MSNVAIFTLEWLINSLVIQSWLSWMGREENLTSFCPTFLFCNFGLFQVLSLLHRVLSVFVALKILQGHEI